MRHFFLLLCFFLCTINVFAQHGKITFIEREHAFGTIKEVDGPVSHTFVFINKGTSPLRVKEVDVSCGCTTPEWTESAVAPNDTGFITAEFNPDNKPGEFEKYLTIHTDGNPPIDEIKITGFVVARPTVPEDDYPYEYGSLRLKDRNFKIGLISTEKEESRVFEVYNQSESDTLRLSTKQSNVAHIQFAFNDIPPKSSGELTLIYDPNKKNDFGSYLRDKINLPISHTPDDSMTVITSIEEYFPPMSEEELAQAPNISFSKESVVLPNVHTGEVSEATITVKNTGKQTLVLHKVYSSCKCINATVEADSLAPEESTNLYIKFDTKNRKGAQTKNIIIYANSPKQPYSEIKLQTRVLE